MNPREASLEDTRRPIRLVRGVLLTCAVLLVAGAAALAVLVPRNVHAHAVSAERSDLVAFAQTSVIPAAVVGSRLRPQPSAARLRRAIADNPGVGRVLIWRPSGRLAWTSGRRAAGSSAKPSSSVTEARLTGRTTVAASDGLLTVSIPVRRAKRTVAIVAVTANARPIDALVADTRRTVAMTAAVIFGAVMIGVLTLVSVLGWRLRHQAAELTARAAELTDSYRELEQTSLDAIETLNATVEAKDPYTAGHSQRVRRISLAIGRELQLPPKRLGMLAQAALFHDIGKIGVPDAILTKPARLTAAEYEVMKRHASEGADILARLSRLHEAVPAVRHHHEHWDGCGYPDGLREEEIPLEASIIGLADAWDAMTTTRPYATARSPHEAMAELERASGSQFNPAVVTAFLEAARRHPLEIMPPDQPPILVAVG